MKLFSLKNCWGEEFLNKCLNPQKSSWQSSKQEHCDTRNEEGSGYSNSSTSHRILKQSCPRIKLNPLPKVKNSWQGRWRSSSLSPSEWVTPQQQSLGMQEHTSHPWKSATHFQCLTSPKTQIQGCFCQLNTQDSAVLRTAEILTKPDLYKMETGNLPSPKGTGSKCRVHREGAQLQRQQQSNALKATMGCWEPRPTLLLPGHLVGQLTVLWLIMRSKMTEWRPSQRGSRPHS